METYYGRSEKECEVSELECCEKWDMHAMHYHDAYEIYILEKGERSYIIEDDLVDLSVHDAALIRPYEIHSTAGGAFRRWLLSFRKSYLAKFFTAEATEALLACFSHRKIHVDEAEYPRLRAALKVLRDHPEDFAEFFEVLRILLKSEPKTAGGASNSGEPPLISKVIAYIAQNYQTLDSLEDIAARFYISKYYLCRIFKEKTGVSVIHYIHIRKIQAACELLKTTQSSVSEIAFQCGFHSSMYFCRTFKNMMGVTPSAYRKA